MTTPNPTDEENAQKAAEWAKKAEEYQQGLYEKGLFHTLKEKVRMAPETFLRPVSRKTLFAKVFFTAAGAVMVPHGLYHLISGTMEQPTDAKDHQGINITRCFTGAFETALGAATLYYAVTGGGNVGKILEERAARAAEKAAQEAARG